MAGEDVVFYQATGTYGCGIWMGRVAVVGWYGSCLACCTLATVMCWGMGSRHLTSRIATDVAWLCIMVVHGGCCSYQAIGRCMLMYALAMWGMAQTQTS
jgi:hypothetical protein